MIVQRKTIRDKLAMFLGVALMLTAADPTRAEDARAIGSNQTLECSFSAEVVTISPIEQVPASNQLKGYLIDKNPKWEITLKVLPHASKIPFQPGMRRCYVASIEEVFGVDKDQVCGEYHFTYTWNVDVPGKPEFENFKAKEK
jgi:hypothetical protein